MKAVIFDCDGMVNIEERFSKRLSKFVPIETSLPFFKNEFQLCLIGKADLKEELGKKIELWGGKLSVENLLALWFSPKDSHIQRDFQPIIENLRGRGIVSYLATNNEKYRTEYLTTNLGIGKWFDGVFSSSNVGFKKPEKEFYEYIFSHISEREEETLYWDDDPEHIAAARNFGIPSELFTTTGDFKIVMSRCT